MHNDFPKLPFCPLRVPRDSAFTGTSLKIRITLYIVTAARIGMLVVLLTRAVDCCGQYSAFRQVVRRVECTTHERES